MLRKIILLFAASMFAITAFSVLAGEHSGHSADHKMVVALKTDDFELAETDISDLEIGDTETVYTESGKTIDLLRTEDGIEIYVDGELLEVGLGEGEGSHEGDHVVHRHVEVICDQGEECEDLDLESLHGEDHHEKVIVIRKEIDSD